MSSSLVPCERIHAVAWAWPQTYFLIFINGTYLKSGQVEKLACPQMAGPPRHDGVRHDTQPADARLARSSLKKGGELIRI
ncbi:MAG: hypothetical protein DRI73_02470 [Bacteroidetes bacterium]|nr:MAG: hypothetical protein DRI73_02470 [Bacteroidota bacterium]